MRCRLDLKVVTLFSLFHCVRLRLLDPQTCNPTPFFRSSSLKVPPEKKTKKQALNLPLVVGWQPLISSATINLAGHTHIGVSVQPPGQPVDVSIDGRCISSLHRLPSGPLVAHL